MAYCRNCGYELHTGERFCRQCGMKTDNPQTATQPMPPQPPMGYQQMPPQPPMGYQQPPQPPTGGNPYGMGGINELRASNTGGEMVMGRWQPQNAESGQGNATSSNSGHIRQIIGRVMIGASALLFGAGGFSLYKSISGNSDTSATTATATTPPETTTPTPPDTTTPTQSETTPTPTPTVTEEPPAGPKPATETPQEQPESKGNASPTPPSDDLDWRDDI